MAYYKAIMEAGVELRHIEGNKVSSAITKDEYMAAPLAAIEEQIVTEAAIPSEIVWSTRRDVVSQSSQIFQMMWQNAMRGEARIKQLEEGVEPEVTLVIENMDRVYKLGKKMNEECEQEALMIVASEKTISRNKELFSLLAKRQKKLGFDIRILAPYIDQSAVTEIFPDSEWRRLEHPINVSIIIYDRRKMFITQYWMLKLRAPREQSLRISILPARRPYWESSPSSKPSGQRPSCVRWRGRAESRQNCSRTYSHMISGTMFRYPRPALRYSENSWTARPTRCSIR